MEGNGREDCAESSNCSARNTSDELQEQDTEQLRSVELNAAEIEKMEFNTHEKAYEFYCKYARCIGFGVRKADTHRDKQGMFTRRKFVCKKEGLKEKKYAEKVDRKRDPRLVTRTNCNARLMICRDKVTLTWKVTKFVEEHNYSLTPHKFVHLIANHRRLTDADKAQIDSMHRSGIQTCKIMGFMAGQAGSYAGLGFTKKDLYNYIGRERRDKLTHGDALAAISYLQGKADSDPLLDDRYNIKEDSHLENLVWADGLSRIDYACFGDVLSFDATYKKNKYKLPLVIFSGTNHHRQTCIFAFALLSDERVETYKWLLENFLSVMNNKQPSVVVTDGDEAMREAIKVFFPNATHRLCAWHLEKNATSNIKDQAFCQEFKKCIYTNVDPVEFEVLWDEMIQQFGMQENSWVMRTYKRKEMWANAYLRDKFYAGVRTTSRCEGINSFVKRFVTSRQSILELVQQLERVLKEYRNNELVADYKSMDGEPTLTTQLESIEHSAAKVYTREVFMDVQKQILGAGGLIVLECDSLSTTVFYKVAKFSQKTREKTVMYERNSKKFDCQCRLWNTHGIPCSHIFCVMMHEGIGELPETLILKRWTKAAKSHDEAPGKGEEDAHKEFMVRYGALCSASMWMSFLAAQEVPDYRNARDIIRGVTSQLQQKKLMVDVRANNVDRITVLDPVIEKTKGAPPAPKNATHKRRCTNCSKTGHTKRTCQTLKGESSRTFEEEYSSYPTSPDPDASNATNKQAENNPPVPSTCKLQPNGEKNDHTTPVQSQTSSAGPHSNHFCHPYFFPAYPHLGIPGYNPVGLPQYQYPTDPGHQWYLQVR